MSDYRAVAAATLTLQNLLSEAIREAVPGAIVKTGPPEVHSPEEVGEGLINIFLYKAEPNKVWRNEELPSRRADGTLIRRPQLALDVFYLLSFYGDERRKVPYLLLGLSLSALHAEPYPNVRHMPRKEPAAGDGGGEARTSSLAGSGLEFQPHPLSFTLLPLSHDELIPLFSQIPFVMSVAYRASVLLLEPQLAPQPPLPVRRADLHLGGGVRPVLAAVQPQHLAFDPETRLRLTGQGLGGRFVKVLFGDLEGFPTGEPDGALSVALPPGIQAGTHLLRLVHGVEIAAGEVRWAAESNPVALVVEPVVVDALQVGRPAPVAATEGASEGERRTVTLSVRFAPRVFARTPVVVLLNEIEGPGGGSRPRSFAFQAVADPTSPDSVILSGDIAPASYLVRVQIGGVTSRLAVDDDPASPTFERFVGPRLVIGGEPA